MYAKVTQSNFRSVGKDIGTDCNFQFSIVLGGPTAKDSLLSTFSLESSTPSQARPCGPLQPPAASEHSVAVLLRHQVPATSKQLRSPSPPLPRQNGAMREKALGQEGVGMGRSVKAFTRAAHLTPMSQMNLPSYQPNLTPGLICRSHMPNRNPI